MNEQALLQQLHDIHDYLPTPAWKTPWPYIIIFGLVLLSLLAVWYVQRKRRVIPLTLWQQAELEITSLIINEHRSAEFYQQLTDIMKRYLQERFSVQIQDKTDFELLVILDQLQFQPQVTQEIRTLFGMVTEIKFGRMNVLPEAMAKDKQRALSIIHMTVPETT
jgi:hypothetical protein